MTTKTQLEQSLFDSDDELQFAHWLTELQDGGLVKEWTRDVPPYQLTSGLTHNYTVTTTLKTKVKVDYRTQTLLRESVYTPDFRIMWAEGAREVLFQTMGSPNKITKPFIAHGVVPYSVVEIKPPFDRNNMTRLFINNQKMVWDKFMEYVNLVEIRELFAETFTPQSYLYTPKTKQPRRLAWTATTSTQYINALSNDQRR